MTQHSRYKSSRFHSAIAIVGWVVMLSAHSSSAATLYWDPTGTFSASGSGSGTWDTGITSDWWISGPADSVWTDVSGADTAIFGGAAGTYAVNVTGNNTANTLTFNAPGYTLSGGTATLAGGTPTITANADATINSVIAGNAGLNKVGTGTLTVTGSNTYTGGTFVNAGTLLVTQTGSLPGYATSAAVSVASGATLAVQAGGIGEWDAGSLGNLLGTTAFAASSNLGINVLSGNTFSYAGDLGAGQSAKGLVTLGPGTLVLTGPNTYTGGTTISAGTLQLGNGFGGNDGSIAGSSSIVDNATLVYDLAGNQTYGGAIGGNGGMTKIGAGTLTLTGSNTYSGNTTVDGGAIQIPSGWLASPIQYVGYSGTGAFTQSGGTNSASSIYLGYNTGSSGTYNLGGGGQLLVSSYEDVGYSSTGTFTQFGGTNSMAGLVLGVYGSGTYNLSGSGQLSAPWEYVGDFGTGTFTQSGGTNSATNLYVGEFNSGTYSLSGSGRLVSNYQYVGYAASGGVMQSGGTNTISSFFVLGNNPGGSGTYNLSGSGQLSAPTEYVGGGGTGTFTQSGGTNSISNVLELGAGTGGSGTYNLSGSGQLSAPTEYVGGGGTGTFTQSGGTNSISNVLELGAGTGSSGTYNLNGGVLVLSGLNHGSGAAAFNFNGGKLQAGRSFTTNLPMTLGASGGGAAFDTAGYSVTLSGSLSGPGSLTKLDSGTLTLATVNSYSGNTLIGGGTLVLGNSLALQNSTLDTSGTGTLSFGSLTAGTLGGLTGPGTLRLANASSSLVALSVGNNNASTTFSGILNGPGGLIKIGSGGLLLSGSNSYAGPTIVNNGVLTLDFSAVGAPGSNIINNASSSSALVLGGAVLAIQGNAAATNNQQFNGLTLNLGASALQAVSGSSGTLSLGLGAINCGAGGTIDFTLPASGTINTTTISKLGVLVGNTGTAYATVNGGSTFAAVSGGQIVGLTTYSNTNSFSGNPLGTTLITQNLSPASGAAYTGVVAFGSPNTTLTLTGINDLADSGGILVTPAAVGTVIGGGSLHAGGGNAVVIMDYGSLNVASPIVDNAVGASLTVSGPGITTLSAPNTYTGQTYINNGSTLQVGNGGNGASIGSTSGVIDNGSLVFNHGDAVTFNRKLSGAGSLVQSGSGVLTLTIAAAYTGPTTINGGTLQLGNGVGGYDGSIASSSIIDNAALVFDLYGSQTYGGAISGSGLINLVSGSVTLSGLNPFSGQTQLSGGALVLGNAGALENSTYVAGLGKGPMFAPGIGTFTFGGLSGSSALYLADTRGAAVTLQVGNNGASTAYSGVLSGGGSLVKLGSGALTLTATSSFSGPTTISGGTLQIGDGTTDGSIASSSGINNNATLVCNVVGNQSYGNPISGAGTLYKTGSGTLYLTGNNTLGGKTFLCNGTIVMSAASTMGLYEGLVSKTSGRDTTDPVPRTSIQPVARWGASTYGDTNSPANNVYPNWGDDTTWGYSGYILNKSGSPVTYTFGKNFDDNGYLVIDGVSVINNTTWYDSVTGSITLAPGLHAIDLRFGQGNGPVGPNTGAYNNYGISYNTLGITATNSNSWLPMGASDPNTQFFASLPGAASSSVVMSSNTTLDLSTANMGLVFLGSLADAPGSPTGHQVLLGGNTLETGLDNSSTAFSGTISGNGGSLIKQGTGTFTLAGPNTYSGGTTISAGTLQLGNGTVGNDGSIAGSSIFDNAALVYDLAGSQTYGGTISGPGSLTMIGTGTLTLVGPNTYSGGTTVIGGTLYVTNSNALADGSSLTVGADGMFDFDPLMASAPAAASTLSPVPEPGTLALFAAGSLLVAFATWRRRKTVLGERQMS